MIRVEGLAKRFGSTVALRDVSFRVARGEVVGFVGPNGAGKTTTLRIITGFIDPDAGRAIVDGIDVAREGARARQRIGYLPESAPLYRDMRVAEYLLFRARLKGQSRREAATRVDAVVEQVGIADHRRRLIGRLSKGYRQRVGLADALVARPPILILDEPTAGLDPIQVREFRRLLIELAEQLTVLLSSHILTEIEAVASRVVVLSQGDIVGAGRVQELRHDAGVPADASLEDVFVALTSRGGSTGEPSGSSLDGEPG